MKRVLSSCVMLALVLALAIPGVVLAADTGEVACTASGKLISVAVTDGAVAYGVLDVGGTQDTVTLTDTQTATNDGTVTEDFNIKSSNAIGTTQDWVLATEQGSAECTHEFSLDSGSTWELLATGVYETLSTEIASAGTEDFDLQFGMPSEGVTDYGAHTLTVTVQAVEHE